MYILFPSKNLKLKITKCDLNCGFYYPSPPTLFHKLYLCHHGDPQFYYFFMGQNVKIY